MLLNSINACKFDCVLFWKRYSNCQRCTMYGESRYKIKYGKGKKIPNKILCHFSLIPRLKPLFSSKHIASEMRWHKDKRVETNGVLWHPADAEEWKCSDKKFPEFASDLKNVRLALASDKFNPFGNMSNACSMWPVVLIPYNLPPWKCMKESSFSYLYLYQDQSPLQKKLACINYNRY